ncbi:pyridoxamine 5'-phosphate oxidase-domain-containing protein [Annulohypoxylon truncatum]|uniref:pyridoxamine 5'-phosphate oxidase-domain-containing protein n=1 Tax=Annulohypoxylon truncatum TaxID=327061 RepID=UPI0020081BA0|nr:pyridoxamine 5'-phosphate oxidase-domain-containing protein [Annulohypoxylon truncatum]KAI1209897.1 pyridoxamine 5'-phosphate oxidase-domain-containing protein [Annulohypoxylon truncatum]
MQRFVCRPSIASSSRLAQVTTHLVVVAYEHLTRRTMATVSTLGPAPWRKVFLEHVQTMPSPEFSLGTVRKTSTPTGGVACAPRTRTCVFRGLFADLPANPKNEAELNPDLYESDFLALTTDRRMDKMAELFGVETGNDGNDGGDEEEEAKKLAGSGGGAPVEAVFWVKETSTQWRVRGRAYVLAPDIEGSPEGRQVISKLRARMRRKKNSNSNSNSGAAGSSSEGSSSGSGGSSKQWSFGREITAHFGNLSPQMRGTFRNPAPGTPVALPVRDGRLGLGQKVVDLRDEVARSNFRVVVLVPDELDRADLSDPERARRWLYTFVGGGKTESTTPGGSIEDGWEKVEVWP